MATFHPHINFNGNAQEAFDFYRAIFGGDFTKVIRLKDLAGPEFLVEAADAEKLLHIALTIGSGHVLIGNDVPSFMGKVNEMENRSKISVRVESKEEADRVFSGLSEGAAVEMPIGDSPWGSYFGMLRDKYGIEWEVEFTA